MPRLILASASAARKQLLESIGWSADIIAPMDIDETPHKKERPETYVLRIAREKARAAQKKFPGDFIVTADTIAAAGTRIIGKAENENAAKETMLLLSGRKHRVYTGVTVVAPNGKIETRRVLSTVNMKRLTPREIADYLASQEWVGKSGCYTLMGRAGAFISGIHGSFSNILGLPLYETRNMLLAAGYKKD